MICLQVSLGYSNKNNETDVKGVVRLYIINILTFNTYYDPSKKSWKEVARSITYYLKLLKFKEVCNCVSHSYLLPAKTTISCTTCLL